MPAEVVRIVNDRNARYSYKRLIFKLNDGSYAKTDIVVRDKATGKPFRNAKRWKPFMKVGKLVDNLRLLSSNKVDADSIPCEWRKPLTSLEMIQQGLI